MSSRAWLFEMFPCISLLEIGKRRVAKDKDETEKTRVADSTIIPHFQSQEDTILKELTSINSEDPKNSP